MVAFLLHSGCLSSTYSLGWYLESGFESDFDLIQLTKTNESRTKEILVVVFILKN
jgi:hypothetical protein